MTDEVKKNKTEECIPCKEGKKANVLNSSKGKEEKSNLDDKKKDKKKVKENKKKNDEVKLAKNVINKSKAKRTGIIHF